jgi:hypothetical protein
MRLRTRIEIRQRNPSTSDAQLAILRPQLAILRPLLRPERTFAMPVLSVLLFQCSLSVLSFQCSSTPNWRYCAPNWRYCAPFCAPRGRLRCLSFQCSSVLPFQCSREDVCDACPFSALSENRGHRRRNGVSRIRDRDSLDDHRPAPARGLRMHGADRLSWNTRRSDQNTG